MRVCIVGAGSIGGFLGARLARAGAAVTLVARGAHLAALRERGLRLIESDGSCDDYRITAAGSLSEVGQQDVVALGMKAHQVEAVVADLPRLVTAGTTVLPLQNGIPWWYFQRHGGPHEGRRLSAVDPHGAIAAAIPAESILGCVVYPACDLPAPGVVRHVEGDRFPIGELDGSTSVRAQALSDLFATAGLKAPVLAGIRSEIWLKLWGNLCFNPISALTRSTLDRICGEPLTRSLAAAMMREAEAVAGALGISFRVSLERRIEGAARVGSHKTSMLQDIEAGRATEIDALLGAVIELARLTSVPVPHLEALYACTRLLENTLRGPAAMSAAPPAAPAAARVA